ncbi:MAG: DUF2786 domain-containing protein [Reyranella sp.]|nr:DUF2786 domain-containing protein [Reyranella sp.]
MRGRERERLVKLLSLTNSSNDGEALAALRKCNDMLKQHRLNWDDIVVGEADRVVKTRTRNNPASPSRTFEASLRRERLFEQARREQQAMALRFYIRKVPMPLRLLFFPLWATAEILAGVVELEAGTFRRAAKSFAAVFVLAASSIIWLQAVDLVALLVEEAADAAVPWAEQSWLQLDGDQDRPTAGGTGLNGPFNRSR